MYTISNNTKKLKLVPRFGFVLPFLCNNTKKLKQISCMGLDEKHLSNNTKKLKPIPKDSKSIVLSVTTQRN